MGIAVAVVRLIRQVGRQIQFQIVQGQLVVAAVRAGRDVGVITVIVLARIAAKPFDGGVHRRTGAGERGGLLVETALVVAFVQQFQQADFQIAALRRLIDFITQEVHRLGVLAVGHIDVGPLHRIHLVVGEILFQVGVVVGGGSGHHRGFEIVTKPVVVLFVVLVAGRVLTAAQRQQQQKQQNRQSGAHIQQVVANQADDTAAAVRLIGVGRAGARLIRGGRFRLFGRGHGGGAVITAAALIRRRPVAAAVLARRAQRRCRVVVIASRGRLVVGVGVGVIGAVRVIGAAAVRAAGVGFGGHVGGAVRRRLGLFQQ